MENSRRRHGRGACASVARLAKGDIARRQQQTPDRGNCSIGFFIFLDFFRSIGQSTTKAETRRNLSHRGEFKEAPVMRRVGRIFAAIAALGQIWGKFFGEACRGTGNRSMNQENGK
ncbi:hypothetical protein [Aquibium microcysteis]|uniref:hypothetical protein n=1 Tax=Aquibium microcysteis TaxID=675281 RepID=UPI00165D1151|nr:hypothetical protein [Aquibium microcysteis]